MVLEYDSIPGIMPIYLKILSTRKRGFKPGDDFPAIRAIARNVRIDREKLSAYREICELEDDGCLPVLYPHVFTAPMHMAILSQREFPIPLLGVLHYRNHLVQHRPIREDETLDIEVALTEHRIVKQGLEFDYTIEISSRGELVWNSITTYLKQGKFGKDFNSSPRSELIETMSGGEKISDSQIPENIGKRYAKICSDYNVIHISKIAAKLFGFRRDIAHAMWATALSIGKLGLTYDRPVRVDLAFKGPLFIGSKSHIMRSAKKDSIRFDYYIGGNERPCIVGKVSFVNKGAKL